MTGTGPRRERSCVTPADPGHARTFDDLVDMLRSLKVWAGDPSYDTIKYRVNIAWTAAGRPADELTKKTTVADCFRTGRRRLNSDLVLAVVEALHPDVGYVAQWRQALRVVGGEIKAVSQVRVHDTLPRDLATFTGRTAELQRLCGLLSHATQGSGTVVISAIEGMAGVGKTELAVHAAHLLCQSERYERVLFVNLRGFHPDPAQPPADPAAVLDGFLRLLGVPAQTVPHDLDGLTAAYRARLAGSRALVILDNAADADQVRPLLPEAEGCPVLVTSRRSLADLPLAMRLSVDVFTPDDALEFLTRAASQTSVGDDPDAAGRIARRCGYLPLALGLVAGHVRAKPDWTLTDHAEWLDDRHRGQRLDTGVELALDLSYRHLPAARQRLLRLFSLHPGPDFDIYAAAALAGTDLDTARIHLRSLRRDHLLQQTTPGRHTFHDLVRAYATNRASDEDRPPERRAALTRLFDHYLATTAAAMNSLYPGETHLRPRACSATTPTPVLTDPDTARAWLDTERLTLVAVAAYTAIHGWRVHTVRLSRTLFRYLEAGHHTDAATVHGHANDAALDGGDPIEQAHALTNLGVASWRLGQNRPAAAYFQQAHDLFRRAGDPAGQARALNNLGTIEEQSGGYRTATDRYARALILYRQAGDRNGEARALANLGNIEQRLGRHSAAADHYERALTLNRQAGDQTGEAYTLNNLGMVETQLGWCGPARDHLQRALVLFRRLGNSAGEGWTLDSLGTLDTRLGQPGQATEYLQQALAIFRETSDPVGETCALNSLGEATQAAGRAADALAHHTTAHTLATDTGAPDQLARAHAGLGRAHDALDNPAQARRHYEHALSLYTDLGAPEADQIRDHLAEGHHAVGR